MAAQTRPRDFVINPFHSLAKGLVFAGFGSNPKGQKYLDSSLKRNHGLRYGSNAIWSHELGRCVYKTDTVSYMQIPNLHMSSTFSFAGWLYIISSPSYHTIIGEYDAPQYSWVLCTTPFEIIFYGDSMHARYLNFDLSKNLGKWLHLALSNGVSGFHFWLNGKLNMSDDVAPFPNNGQVPIYIGASPSFDMYLNSFCADFCLWNRVLSNREVATLANTTNPMLDAFLLPSYTAGKKQKLIYPSLEIPTGGYALV